MSDWAIEAEGVGKSYRINAGPPQSQLTEKLEGVLRAPARRLRRQQSRRHPEEFWALREVSFAVRSGEALGIVGPNGAGKSTLLKLLSRITFPTEGRLTLRGRVGTMLEVGTGFHPELTGRENVFLNGTILGMRRREVQARFDEIVEFSGIERFIDTPVKRYSSGMYVRLAFAVAAHLEPEILLIDEVLAVGDADFQRKSLDKMASVVREDGRTILFVSHNLPAIERVCGRALMIESGHKVHEGSAHDVVREYLRRHEPLSEGGEIVITSGMRRWGGERARLVGLALLGPHDLPTAVVTAGQRFSIRTTFKADIPVEDAAVEIGISTAEGWRIVTAYSHESEPLNFDIGTHHVTASFPGGLLPGDYRIDVGLHREAGVSLDMVEGAFGFTVSMPDDIDTLGRKLSELNRGYVRGDATWRHAASVVTVG